MLKGVVAAQATMQQDMRRFVANQFSQRSEQAIISEAVQQSSRVTTESRVMLTSMLYQGISSGNNDVPCLPKQAGLPRQAVAVVQTQPASLAAKRRKAIHEKFEKQQEERRMKLASMEAAGASAAGLASEEPMAPWTTWDGHNHSFAGVEELNYSLLVCLSLRQRHEG